MTKQLYWQKVSNLFQLPQDRLHIKAYFKVFLRYMCQQYIFADSAGKQHQFHVKSNWQLPPQPALALESYLERTKIAIASITISNEKGITNLSAQKREAMRTLSANKEIKLKRVDKDTTTVIMDTGQKIQESLEKVSKDNFYKPLIKIPVVSSTNNSKT